MITVVALLCHSLAGIPAPVCREEIITQQNMPMTACMMGQPEVADWKEKSIYPAINGRSPGYAASLETTSPRMQSDAERSEERRYPPD